MRTLNFWWCYEESLVNFLTTSYFSMTFLDLNQCSPNPVHWGFYRVTYISKMTLIAPGKPGPRVARTVFRYLSPFKIGIHISLKKSVLAVLS